MTASREELIARLSWAANKEANELADLLNEAAAALQSQQQAPASLGPVSAAVDLMRHDVSNPDLAPEWRRACQSYTAYLDGALSQQAGQAGVVDEAMVERAFKAFCNYPLKMGREDEKQLIRAALQAALNGRET